MIILQKLHNYFGSGLWIFTYFKLEIFPSDFMSAQRNVNLPVFIAGYPQMQVIYQRALYTLTQETALLFLSGWTRAATHNCLLI